MHIGSGVDYATCSRSARPWCSWCAQRPPLQAISAGGGLSIPYREGEPRIDTAHYFSLWDAARREIAAHLGHAVHLELEPGRYLVAEAGVLLAEVRATKWHGRQHFTLVDAGFSDLMRPAMYGAFHGMSLLPCDDTPRPVRLGGGRPAVRIGRRVHPGRRRRGAHPRAARGPRGRPAGAARRGRLRRVHVQQLQQPAAGTRGAGGRHNHRLIRRRQTVDELLALEAV
jgi:diaminopimelate decarboxylase